MAATGEAVFSLLRFYHKSGDGVALRPMAPHHKSHFPPFKLWKFGLVNLRCFAIGNSEVHKFGRTDLVFLLCIFIGFDFSLSSLFLHILRPRPEFVIF